MFKFFKAAVNRVRSTNLLQPEALQVMLTDEVALLQKERIRAVSKMHRAMCDVAFYDNLLDQLDEELGTGQRSGALYEAAES